MRKQNNMKNAIVLLAFVITGFAQAQKIDSVAVMKESDLTKEFFSDKNRGVKVGEFILNDGNSLKVGDIIKIGKPSGVDYNIGFTGKKEAAYDHIMLGTPQGSLLKGIRYASTSDVENKEFKVIRIASGYGMGNATIMSTMIPYNHKLAVDKYITVMYLNKSIANGEILLANMKMTKDEAIRILEEKKKLMDLGLIPKDEFEKFREELKPIILQ